jgi:hypothetical protein
VLAGAVAAFDIAFRSHCQVHPAILVVIAAKAGMPLNLILHIARSCHGFLLKKKKARRK